jgi:hypothetical protein
VKRLVGYTAVETFDPSKEEKWSNYIQWSGLTQLNEVVSLDCSLCPGIIDRLVDEDWNQNVYSKIFFALFGNLDYLLNRIKTHSKYQILATIREPNPDDIKNFKDNRFIFKGYDLLEEQTRISALTNCGGFDLAFNQDDISESGLIEEYNKAFKIRKLLLKNYPNENHADCSVWAIWKMVKS